jgi:hypothetical protein
LLWGGGEVGRWGGGGEGLVVRGWWSGREALVVREWW